MAPSMFCCDINLPPHTVQSTEFGKTFNSSILPFRTVKEKEKEKEKKKRKKKKKKNVGSEE